MVFFNENLYPEHVIKRAVERKIQSFQSPAVSGPVLSRTFEIASPGQEKPDSSPKFDGLWYRMFFAGYVTFCLIPFFSRFVKYGLSYLQGSSVV